MSPKTSDAGYVNEEKPEEVASLQEVSEEEIADEEGGSDGEVSVSILETIQTETPSGSTQQPTASTTVTAQVGYKTVTFKVQVEKSLDLNSLVTDEEAVKEQLSELKSSEQALKLKKKQELLILGEIGKMRMLSETITALKKAENAKKPKTKVSKPVKSKEFITLRFRLNGVEKTLSFKKTTTTGDVRKKLTEIFGLLKGDNIKLKMTFSDTVISVNTRAEICGDTLKGLGVVLKENDLIEVTFTK